MALLGPSGSGKTTLLRMIAGFEIPDAGRIAIGDRLVAGADTWVEPEQRRVGMVFQDGALFPHLTVESNVAFGATRRERVAECLELVGLPQRARSFPHELSGGERQRIALARALASDPEVVLLDEPFAALDANLRESLRQEVRRILKEAGKSALLVTHDQAEALSLADTVAVMRGGHVLQVGTPEEIYERPRSRWLAEFLGETDVLPGRRVRRDRRVRARAVQRRSRTRGARRRRAPSGVGGDRPRTTQAHFARRARRRAARSSVTTSSWGSSSRAESACAAVGSASRPGIPATASGFGSMAR